MGKIKSDKKTRIHLKPLGQGQASQLSDSSPSSNPNLDTASKDIIKEVCSCRLDTFIIYIWPLAS